MDNKNERKITVELLQKNNNDHHLNVFWCYSGKPEAENNITKAFINTIDSLDNNQKMAFIRDLCSFEISEKAKYSFYLQTKPPIKNIDAIDDEYKVLIAFSPTGKSWGRNGIDKNNMLEIKESISDVVSSQHPDWNEKEINDAVREEYNTIIDINNNRGEAVPDAWIIIEDENNNYCIAFENKLYDLNPYQLNNHCKKALKINREDYDKIIKYIKYSDIIELLYKNSCLQKEKSYLVDEFIRYMYLLGYYNITNFSQLEGATEDCLNRYIPIRAKHLLEDLQKDIKSEFNSSVVYKKKRGFVLKISHPYCHEIRIDYIDKKIEIPLYFASTMCVARDFYKNIEPEKILLKDKWTYGFAFHLSACQKNIDDTYCCWNCDCTLEEYLSFWKNNPQLLNQSDQKQRDALFEKMRALKIPEDAYQEVLKWSSKYEKKRNVIPEIGVYILWPFTKAIEYDKDGEFVSVIKSEINEVFNCLHCEEIFENDF